MSPLGIYHMLEESVIDHIIIYGPYNMVDIIWILPIEFSLLESLIISLHFSSCFSCGSNVENLFVRLFSTCAALGNIKIDFI